MKKFFTLCSVALLAASAFADNMALKVTTPEAKANPWDSQVFINFPTPLEAGKQYTIQMDVKGSYDLEVKDGQYGPEAIQPIVQDNNSENRDEWGGPADLQYLAHFTLTTEWVKDVLDCNGNAIVTDGNFPYSRLLLNLGNLGGDIYVDNVKMVDAEGNEAFCITFDTPEEQALVEDGWMGLAKEFVAVEEGGEVAPVEPVEPAEPTYVVNDDVEGAQQMIGWGGSMTISIAEADGNHYYEVNNPELAENNWSVQVAYDVETPYEVGTEYTLEMDIKGSVEGTTFACGLQNTDGWKGCGDFGAIDVTTEWQTIKLTTTCNGEGATRFVASIGDYAGTLCIDNVKIYAPAAGINDVKVENTVKAIYNIAGQKMNAAKGLSIVNGKLIMVK